MPEIVKFGLVLAKGVLQVYGVDASGRAVCAKQMWRKRVLSFSTRPGMCCPDG